MSFIRKLFGKNKSEEHINVFSGEDPGMLNAIRQAQSEFESFAKEVELESHRILPAMGECLIKYAFPAEKGDLVAEHMFITDIYFENGILHGTLASEPMYTTKIKEGDHVIIDPQMVSDWLYIIGNVTYGGYTFKHMWQCFSEEEKTLYRDQPPFMWLDLSDV